MLAVARPGRSAYCNFAGEPLQPWPNSVLEAGSHVYIEKPFALNEADTIALLNLASSMGLKMTAGHDDQFSHVARRMRSLIGEGYLGGPPVHMESYYCYEMATSTYANSMLSDQSHWTRRLPGKLLHNIISHGIARIAEHLVSDSPKVIAHGFVSSPLRKMGETEIIDELRAIISEPEGGATGYFTFSSQMRPSLHQFRIYGPRNGLILDQDQETLIRLRGKKAKSYLEKFATPVQIGRQYYQNVRSNLGRFLQRDFQMKSGMKNLIELFYQSIREDGPLPIPYREIVLTASIMDSIFAQLQESSRAARDEEGSLALSSGSN